MVLPQAVQAALAAVWNGATAAALESATLEFKTQGRSVRDAELDLAHAAACFANAQGGTVVVGIRDRQSGSEAFEGCTLDIASLHRRVFELTDPSLVVRVEEARAYDCRIVVLTIPPSPDVHQVQGRATERLGNACEPMNARRIAAVHADKRGDDWSSEASGRGVAVASARALEEARRMLRELPDPERRSWADESDGDLLRRLGLVAPDGTLSRGGELLFAGRTGTPDEILYVFRRGASGPLVANERLSGPLISAMIRTLELAEARVDRTPVNLRTGQQLHVADLPDAAVREALVNGVVHRDYRTPHPVHVEHSPERLAVTSPGPFVPGVSPANVLTTSPRARNPALANAVRGLGLAEAAGVGVDRMYAEMTRVGHQPPVFDADAFQVRVTLLGGAPNVYVTRYLSALQSPRSVDPDTPLVLLTLLAQRTVTAAQMAPLLQRTEEESQTVLEALCAPPISMIERTRQSARSVRGTYRLREEVIAALGPAVSYRRRTLDQADRKIIGLVKETGQVNGRMVRLLLDVDSSTASRLLADMVDRLLLVKTSQAQRGPSVTYGPGPRFPRTSGRGGQVDG